MILQRAINTLTPQVRKLPSRHQIVFNDALKLGIEALKRIQLMRQDNAFLSPPLLPGETKE